MNLDGIWVVDHADQRALHELGDVLLEFRDDGSLRYTIRSGEKSQIILLHYEIDGETLVTDQPSAPRVERTAFSFSDDGALVLFYGGQPYRFKRMTMT